MQKITTNQTNTNNQNTTSKSELNLINRQALTLTGITAVSSYSEASIIATLPDTKVTIRGTKLDIKKLDVENGVLQVNGIVDSVVFGKSNVLKRLFK